MEQVKLPRMKAGYWISPNNHFFVVKTHIYSVCDAPEAFGTTERALREAFDRFREPWRSERKAREAIIKVLVEAGWIRLRNYVEKPCDRWSINLPNLGVEPVGRVCAFMHRVYPDGVVDRPAKLDSTERTCDSTTARIMNHAPLPDLRLAPEALPRLVFVETPAVIPTQGIPKISLDACVPDTP